MPPFQHFQPSLDLSESPWKSMNVAFTLEVASSLGARLGASCAKAFGPLAENTDSCPPALNPRMVGLEWALESEFASWCAARFGDPGLV